MRLQATRLIAPALASLALTLTLVGCATVKPPPPASTEPLPSRLAVHIDTIEPASMPQFVRARLDWVAYLRSVGASDLRGTYLQIGDHTFYSIYRFHVLADVVKHGQDQLARMQHVDSKRGDKYDLDSDSVLIFPHTSELWTERPELELGAPSATALMDAGAGELVMESINPPMVNQYWNTWPEIAKALEQVKYPLQRVTFLASLGSGKLMSFWLAPSEAVLKAAPPLAQALAVAVGEARAAELLEKWRASVQATDTQPMIVRHDMTSPP